MKSVEEEDIASSIANISKFFYNLECVNGEKAEGKSSSVMDKPDKKRLNSEIGVYPKFWKSVENYGLLHSEGRCTVLSCDEVNVRLCLKGLDHPFLVVSSNDFNSKDFKNQMGRILLESKASVCLVLDGLRKEGMSRLTTFLKSAVNLFDDRVNIIFFGERGEFTDVDDFSSKHFEINDYNTEMRKKVKNDSPRTTSIGDTVLQKEVDKNKALKKHVDILKKDNAVLSSDIGKKSEKLADHQVKLKQLEEDCTKLKEELKEKEVHLAQFRGDAEEAGMKNTDLVEEISTLQRKCVEIKEAEDEKYRKVLLHSKKVTDEIYELKKEFVNTSEKDQQIIKDLKKESENKQKIVNDLKEKIESQSTVSHSAPDDLSSSSPGVARYLGISVGTQTNVVEYSKSPLSVIREQLSKNSDSPSAVHQAYKSIKNLKCTEKYSKSISGVSCKLIILKGNNIVKYPGLTHFMGEGQSERESKIAAFANFVSSVFEFDP